MRNLSLWIYCIILVDRHQRHIAPYQQYHELLASLPFERLHAKIDVKNFSYISNRSPKSDSIGWLIVCTAKYINWET